MVISSDAKAILSIGDDTTLTCWHWKYAIHCTACDIVLGQGVGNSLPCMVSYCNKHPIR